MKINVNFKILFSVYTYIYFHWIISLGILLKAMIVEISVLLLNTEENSILHLSIILVLDFQTLFIGLRKFYFISALLIISDIIKCIYNIYWRNHLNFLLMWLNKFIDIQILSQACISEINDTNSYVLFPFRLLCSICW